MVNQLTQPCFLSAVRIAVRDGDANLYNKILGHFAQLKTQEEFIVFGQLFAFSAIRLCLLAL